MNPDPARAETLFLAAAEIAAPEERAAFLDEECGDDLTLRVRVDGLLASHDEAGNFLTPAAPSPEMEREFARLKPEEAGERIGHYKLLQQIGEGGFGVVWMAEQEQPVRRRVALKIIKLGMDTKEVIARFEQERQALAMMDHPNIAKVFDAGATPFGRPYFVMELVRGIKITDYCDQASLPTADRLRLFIAVCQAVQHAHQKGIIHRDLKPSNILVTLHDGAPVPKVIDFGVAKAIQQRLTERTLFTQFEQMIGTPLYMSPEQAELSGLDIDTRSDIYSLGVLLYELLTGRTPVDAETLQRAGLDEIRRIIREEEPPRPSMALQTMAAATRTAVAGHRHVEPPRLIGLLRGDLDWIVMKSLEKDRTRRYETASDFALDVRRHLASEPVAARAPSFGYQAGKFVRRNRRVVAAAGAVLLALLAGLIASTVLYLREKTAWTSEAAQRQTAERNAEAEAAARKGAEAIAMFLADVFQSPDPARDGNTITVVEMLNRATKKLDTDLASQPERRARFQEALGRTYHALGLYGEAIQQMEKACNNFVKGVGPQHRDTLKARRDLALFHFAAGHEAEARTRWEEVLPLFLTTVGAEDSDTLWTRSYLALLYDRAGRQEEALKTREEVLKLRRKLSGPEHSDTLFAMSELAISYYHAPDHREKALRLQQEVLALRGKVLGAEHPTTLGAMAQLAGYLCKNQRRDEAVKMQVELLALCRKTLGPAHSETLWASSSLADLYLVEGRIEDAVALMNEWTARSPGFTVGTLKLSALLTWLGKDTDHGATCRRVFQQASETNNPATLDRAAKCYCLAPSSDPQLLETAVTFAQRAVELGRDDSWLRWYQLGLGMAEYRRGNHPAAIKALAYASTTRSAADQATEHPGQSRPIIEVTARLYHAMSLFQQGQTKEARELFAATEAQMKPLPVDGQPYKEWADHDDLICWLVYKEAWTLLQQEN